MPNYQKLLTASTLFLLSSSVALADDDFDPFFELIVMGGIASLDAGNTTVELDEVETDTLTQTNDGDWDSWTAQVGVGYVYPLADDLETGEVQWFPLINPQINLYYLDGGDIAGDVYQFEDPAFNNLDYTMDFDSTRLMFDLGLTVAAVEHFSIYAIAGAGIAWNRLNLNATPNQAGIDCGALGYDTDTENSTSFAYEFGGGMSYAVSDGVAISLEYLYTGFNDVALGDDDDDTFDVDGSDLDINSQAVMLGLRFAL